MEVTHTQHQTLANPKTSATALLTLAADRLGLEMLNWDPETIILEMEQAFGTPLPPANFNKLMAAIELVTTNKFYVSLPDFIRLCNVLYNGTIDPRVFDPADAAEIAWAITEALLIWPPTEHKDNPFDPKILQYIGEAVHDEGIMVPPDILRLGGANNTELWNQVQANFTDDPAMFAAIAEHERAKTDEINDMVKSRLEQLLDQLAGLKLQNGDTTDAVEKMLAQLKQERTRAQELRPAVPN